MGKNGLRHRTLTFLGLSVSFWLVRLVFIWLRAESTYACEWRVGTFARELLTHPFMPPLRFLRYTCIGLADAWQLIEGALLAPVFLSLGPSLLSVKLLATLFAYVQFVGWYLLIARHVDRTTAAIFGLLSVFALPFYLEGGLFLVGTQVQVAVFIPYVFLILLDDKVRETPGPAPLALTGILIGLGMYFAYEYYILFFLAVAAYLIRRRSPLRSLLAFSVTYGTMILPFLGQALLGGERLFSYRGPESREVIALVPGFSARNIDLLAGRAADLAGRYLETFTYRTPGFLGVILFSVFLISLVIIVRRRMNRVFALALAIFAVLSAGRLLSAFPISSPIHALIRDGSGRYFIIGFELILLFAAGLLARMRRSLLGKIAASLILSGFVFGSLNAVGGAFRPAALRRTFPPGYNDLDLGSRLYAWKGGDIKEVLEAVDRKKIALSDRQTLKRGALRTALDHAFDGDLAFSLQAVAREFLPLLNPRDRDLLYQAAGESLASRDPKVIRNALLALEEDLPFMDARSVLTGMESAAGRAGGLEGENFSGLIAALIDPPRRLNADMLRAAGRLWPITDPMQPGRVLRKDAEALGKQLEALSPRDRRAVLGGYYSKAASLFYLGDFGSFPALIEQTEGAELPEKELFLRESVRVYAPIYGPGVAAAIANLPDSRRRGGEIPSITPEDEKPPLNFTF
jgi:hypothetical protein